MAEYSGGTVNAAPTSYATLGNYTGCGGSDFSCGQSSFQIVPTQKCSTPSFGGVSYYDVLTHGNKSNSGYANIVNAYGSQAENCSMSYVKRPCQ